MDKKRFVNVLTGLRLVIAAILLVMTYILTSKKEEPSMVFSMLFLIVCLMVSDFADGHLARRWKVVTDFGKWFDPLADALSLLALYWTLMLLGRVWSIAALITIVRNFISAYYRIHMSSMGKCVASLKTGKYKTAIQLGAAAFLMVLPLYPEVWQSYVVNWLSGMVIIVTVLSSLEYFWVAIKNK